MGEEEYREEKNNRIVRVIITIIAILMIIFGSAYFGYYIYNEYSAVEEEEEIVSIQATTQATTSYADNPIDFESLKEQNDEIYAWIIVPNTNVDYPICQSKSDDSFYLKHSATDKSWLASGAIYTESQNKKTFTDRVTVIYGHNGYSDTMFTTLHYFEDEDFFNENEYFYIYTENSKLTYQIVSAFKYDNRHILNTFDMQDTDVFRQFIELIQNPSSTNEHIRENLDHELTETDNIVVLSTCITGQKSNRYLVCGVLIKNEKTN